MGRDFTLLVTLFCVSLAVSVAAGSPSDVGFRELSGAHLHLTTDVASTVAVDELCVVFDQAVPQWCAYFGIPEQRAADWKVRGCLIAFPERFRAANLLPSDLPRFKSGYSRHDDVWLYDQTSDYYRRHLLLHEGTHAFMQRFLQGNGPPWYSEGMAELLATHHWDGKQLVLGYYPRSAKEVSKWGRIEIMQHDLAAAKAKRFEAILNYGSHAHLENEPYGWCWGAAAFLDNDPRFRERFRQAKSLVTQAHFNDRFRLLIGSDWDLVQREWQVFVANVDYDYDFDRMQTRYEKGHALGRTGHETTISANRAWQSVGVRLEAGKNYRLRARGRYQLAGKPRIWWCEPGGVTIDYWHGQPLGILLGAVVPDGSAGSLNPLVRPQVIGLGTIITPKQAGTLYLRINDAPGSLKDNSGHLTVEVTERNEASQLPVGN